MKHHKFFYVSGRNFRKRVVWLLRDVKLPFILWWQCHNPKVVFLKTLRLIQSCLGLFILIGLACISLQVLEAWADTQIVQPDPAVESDAVKIAMRYHGIQTCIHVEGHGYIFYRGGRVYDLFDYRNFPGLKKLVEG